MVLLRLGLPYNSAKPASTRAQAHCTLTADPELAKIGAGVLVGMVVAKVEVDDGIRDGATVIALLALGIKLVTTATEDTGTDETETEGTATDETAVLTLTLGARVYSPSELTGVSSALDETKGADEVLAVPCAAVTGHTVVLMATTTVVTWPTGQFVTVGGHLVTVKTDVA